MYLFGVAWRSHLKPLFKLSHSVGQKKCVDLPAIQLTSGKGAAVRFGWSLRGSEEGEMGHIQLVNEA